MDLNQAVIARRGRVPLPELVPGDGTVVTRQLDAALVSAGFKLSRDLFEELSRRETGQVLDIGVGVLGAVRAMAGDHVTHNPYFRDFPFNVPPTLQFWAELLERALAAGIVVGSDAYVEIRGGKRLGERLHPHEYARFPHARRVFAVARGEERFPSLAARAEQAFRAGEAARAAGRLADAPGLLFRSLDRLLRGATPADQAAIMDLAAQAAPSVSGRVLLSVREHFQNRGDEAGRGLPRIFGNRKGRAWVRPETRAGIDQGTRRDVLALLDEAVAARLPDGGRVIVDPAVLGVALPLSGKPAAPGLGVMPRGSVSAVVPGEQDVLSFFVYWRQRSRRTDYDLSALMTTADFSRGDFVSWQAYQSADAAVTYSGDITDAPDGATEFISCDLRRMSMPVVIPQVNLYAGEAFDEAAEAFFGYMLRGSAQRGAPFEAATVRMKSDLRGAGRVALPLAFLRGEDGQWRAKWLHFYLKGRASMNIVQASRLSTSLLARTVIERDYLRVAHLAGLMGTRTADGAFVRAATPDGLALAVKDAPGPVTYIGLDRPEGLPQDAAVFTLANLAGLIPA
jgi:hypothetical protein